MLEFKVTIEFGSHKKTTSLIIGWNKEAAEDMLARHSYGDVIVSGLAKEVVKELIPRMTKAIDDLIRAELMYPARS